MWIISFLSAGWKHEATVALSESGDKRVGRVTAERL
jgi:hypothetical protein